MSDNSAILRILSDLGNQTMKVHEGLVRVETSLKFMATKDDITDLRIALKTKADKDDVTDMKITLGKKASKTDITKAMEKHSRSPTAHGYVSGLRKKHWIGIIGLITAITALASTVVAAFYN